MELYARTWGGVLNAARTHKLCTKGLSLVLKIGHNRFQSIQNASINGVIPPHEAVGEKSNRAINNDDSHDLFKEALQIFTQGG